MNGRYTYFLGLGSNIDPQRHFSTAVSRLQAEFGRLLVWPIVETDPVDIATERAFFNTLIVLASEWPPETLKAWTNALEVSCGRNRHDPLSSKKDRPLDIDILAQQSKPQLNIVAQFKEPYMQSVLQAASTLPALSRARCHNIEIAGQSLGQRAATVDTDHTGGHIVIVEDSVDRLFQSFEAPLYSEECLG